MCRQTRAAFTMAFGALAASALMIGATAWAADSAKANLAVENERLRGELAAMRERMSAMERRLGALEARLGPAPGASAAAGATAGAGAPPPGVIPPGVPLPPPGQAPQATTFGQALKGLMPGAVSGAGARALGPVIGGTTGQGVIVSGLEGVPKVFIPDIGGVGDITLRQSDLRQGDPRYNPADDKFRLRDTQIILFSPIDPYTNAQISIDKPDTGRFDVEEAFLVFKKLPWGLTLRAGQYRPVFGLLNGLDTFQLPFVNRPDTLTRYIGDDGFVEPGVNLSAYVPNPWDADLKADLNIVSGRNPFSFNHRGGRTFDFAYIGTLAYSRELFTTGSISAGASMAGGPGRGGQSYLEDPFVTVRYAPDQRHVFTWSMEGLLAEREGVNDHGVKRGAYTFLDYNFWLRYHTGLLLDLADRPNVARGTELGISPVFTYFVSDNTRLRVQYTHQTRSGPERAADEVFLQATFSLGNLKPLE